MTDGCEKISLPETYIPSSVSTTIGFYISKAFLSLGFTHMDISTRT